MENDIFQAASLLVGLVVGVSFFMADTVAISRFASQQVAPRIGLDVTCVASATCESRALHPISCSAQCTGTFMRYDYQR